MLDEWGKTEGASWPLGVSWIQEEEAYNFALYSKNANKVTLILYGGQEFVKPLAIIPFDIPSNKTSRVWHKRVLLESTHNAKYYAYQVDGPNTPQSGNSFDSQKILLDPYARGIFFPPTFSRAVACSPNSNAGQAPLGVLPPPNEQIQNPPLAGPRHGHDLVIYEMHVCGFTRRDNSGVPDNKKGTFAGIVEKIPYLQELGITAIELMPVQQFDPQEGNYWGYMTLNFFSPHAQYSSNKDPDGPLAEFRSMVEDLHKAGIEVFLDVVYNHTTEGGNGGPTYCYRGIDNSTYYALDSGNMSTYVNHSGCGNDLRTAHPAVRQLVVDSLRYWIQETNIDGFRFDLASIFTFAEDGSLNLDDPPIISEITSAPDLGNVRLIAEPWTADGSANTMGRTFPGVTWRQWNAQFRDGIRSFVKSDDYLVADAMTRLYGSTDLFPDDLVNSYRRWQSVNYIDCHDGLNMCDLVSYTNNGYRSWNCGFEGTTGTPPDIARLRRQQIKNFCCLLMLSNGTPMFVAGDEFMNTQVGNGNPYNQDNEITWLNWSLADENSDILRFFKIMIMFRKAHQSIGRDIGWGEDVTWYGPISTLDPGSTSHALAFHLLGGSVGDADLYVMINSYWNNVQFSIQPRGAWNLIIDTSLASPADIVEDQDAKPVDDAMLTVAPRSVVVLVRAQNK
jgi:glycogen operon protein